MSEIFHSVVLDPSRCTGCTHCVSHCPTEAIRVRDGKAHIMKDRCIDCGECIRICPQRAKKAVYDSLNMLSDFKYTVALPAPTLYGQFNNLDDIDYVLSGLLAIGFNAVFEVARAAEIISDLTRRLFKSGKIKGPIISSACPAAVRLIRLRYPDMCQKVLPIISPMELAAKLAAKEAMEKTGLKRSDIGVFFISPCPAKVAQSKAPIGADPGLLDGVLAMNEVYVKLVSAMNKIKDPHLLAKSGVLGIGWACSGGESSALLRDKYISVDGVSHVVSILEELETVSLDMEFCELNCCPGGCVGGVLTVENPYVAKTRIMNLRKFLPVSLNSAEEGSENKKGYFWEEKLDYSPVMQLDDDILKAFEKLSKIEEIEKNLKGLDCSCCGSPTCRAFAEDVVCGRADITDCVFINNN